MKAKKKKKKINLLKIFGKKVNNKLIEKNNQNGKKSVKKRKRNNVKYKGKNCTKKKDKPKRKLWKRLLTFILIMGIAGVLAVATFLGYVVLSSPKFDEDAFKVNDQTVLYDSQGNVIATLGIEKRESVTYADLPQVLIDAIVATEDSKFFQHNGVDLLRFTKATIQQLVGQDAGGASTLTMQVAKNNLTKQGKIEKNIVEKIVRKFQDVYLAVFKIEKVYSKEEIFEFYVNSYYLGGSAYGVQAASEYYFDKDVSELTLPEASLIAGLFQSPGSDDPFKDIDAATSRRNIVLRLMERHGYITSDEANIAKNISIDSLLNKSKQDADFSGFIDTVVTEVTDLTGLNPYSTPMKVYTTMNRKIQTGIDNILNGNTSYKWKDKYVQAGIAIIDSKTGAIAAIGAGRDRINGINYATQAKRQPGSTAKPIFAYGPVIESKNASSYSLYNDEKWGYTNGPNVNNWDGKYKGLVTMRYALQYSRNVPAIKAYQEAGNKNVHKFAYGLGLDVSLNSSSENYKILKTGIDNTVNEAYAIGGVAEGFTPLEMAAAYAAFSNGGYYTEPYSVTKIEFRTNGEVQEFKATKKRVMKDSTAYIINNILESAVKAGFSGGANVSGSHVAAKTGTSNYDDATMKKYKLPGDAVNDLWTVAYTPDYSISVWYGYGGALTKESVKNKAYNTSGTPKDNLMKAVMKYIPKNTSGWKKPSSVVSSEVELGTWPAQLPSENTPSNLVRTEYFVRGTEPTDVSNRFTTLNDVTNLTVNTSNNVATLTWEHTTPNIFTDEYLNEYFGQSVFGNGTSKFIETMKGFQLPNIYVHGGSTVKFSYGNLGFGIYKKELDGTLTLLGFTTNKSYVYPYYSDTTLVVKAEYANFKSNASSGMSIEIKNNNIPVSPPNPPSSSGLSSSSNTKKLIINLDTYNVEASVGSYVEHGVSKLYYGVLDVKNSSTIKYQLINNQTVTEYNTTTDLAAAVNALPAGNYKITYIANYLGNEATASKKVTLK